MPTIALTDRFCASAKPGPGGRTDYFDTIAKGLALRVAAGGRKTWTFNYTSPKNNTRARLSLASYPSTGLAAARGLALEARSHVEAGTDPRDLEAAEAGAMTVNDLIDSYLAKHVRPNLRSAGHAEKRLAKDVRPAIGALRLADLHKRDINRVLDPILARGSPTQARLVFQDMRAMLRWALARGDVDTNVMQNMSAPASGKPRERALSDEEVKTLWNGLPTSLPRSKACQRIIKLCLTLGQRVGEVAGMRSDELDLRARTWTLPGSRVKNGQSHLVPLSDLAIGIIKEALADAGDSAFLFPCGEGHLAAQAVARTIGRANEATDELPLGRFGIAPWSAHDLRRTVLTNFARLGVAPVVAGAVANHLSVTKATVTLSVYTRYNYEPEKRAALELWAHRLTAIVDGTGADVVPLRRA